MTGQTLTEADDGRLGTAQEVAEYLRLPIQTLYSYRLDGRGPAAIKVGRHLRYRWSDVQAWLDSQRDGRPDA
jgi:excisionase family DNA binding protein